MKKRMIRAALIAMVGLMGLSNAYGEGSQESKEDVPVLEWYYIGTPQADVEAVEEALNEYIEPLLGVNVNMNCINWGDEYNQTLPTMLAAGDRVDICFTSNWTNNLYSNVSLGAFLPLNDLIEEHAPRIINVCGPEFLYATSQGGELFAVPTNKEQAHNFGLLVRKDLVEKYEIDLSGVESLAGCDGIFETIKNEEERVFAFGSWGLGDNAFMLLDYDRPVGNRIPLAVSRDGEEVINVLKQENTVEMFKLLRDYYEKGYIQPDSATMGEFVADEAAGIIFATPKSLRPGLGEEYTARTPGYEWIQLDFTVPVMSSTETDGALMAIPYTCEYPEQAIKFLELLYVDPYVHNLVTFGVEGRHYSKTGPATIKQISDSGYSTGTRWMWGNMFLSYTTELENPDVWSTYSSFNKDAIALPSLGFIFDPQSVSMEIGAIQNVWEQYLPALSSGSVEDVDAYLNEALMAFEAAGLSVIEEELIRQYELWSSN